MGKGELYRVATSYFVCGLIVAGGIVVQAAPIMGWSIGKRLVNVESWVKSKKGTIECLNQSA